MPPAERKLKEMTDLRKAGGKKVAAKMLPETLGNLQAIMEENGLDQQAAVIFAVDKIGAALRRKR